MTPGYSPPEQYGTARTDPRTDIYSLGATLYAALSGIIPEDGLARAMDNTQLTPLRKRNSKVSRRLAAAIEKAMGIDPADRFQNAEEFKRSLLGSKSKTQKLPGDYMIDPAPLNLEEQLQNYMEKEPESLPNSNPLVAKDSSRLEEAPVFKPRKKRKRRRTLPVLLVFLLLMAVGVVGAARYKPELLPREIVHLLEPLNAIPIPFLPSTNTPVSLPSPTETPLSIETLTVAATVVPPDATPTPTLAPTETLRPAVQISPTPDNTAVVATPFGGSSGQIAFASARSGIPQIYLMNTDGTQLTMLTNMDKGACQPAWSPDGKQLVFTSPCRARGDFSGASYPDSSLYIMNSDGTGLTQLTTGPESNFDPAWSPEGKRIAFTSLRDGYKQIYMLNFDSRVETRLINTPAEIEASQPAWSPFGNQIAYVVKRVGVYQVWTMTDEGKDNVQLVRSGQNLWDFLPQWSPDGVTLLFNQRDKGLHRPWLMTINLTNSEQGPSRLNFPTPIEDVEFSPDGVWLVFEGVDLEANRDVYLITITGGSLTRLTNDPNVDFDPAWRPSEN